MVLSRANIVAVIFLASLGSVCACSDAEPADPPACSNPYGCDCPQVSIGVSDRRRCVGAPLCNTSDECPMPIEAGRIAECLDRGDLVVNGFRGKCIIPCDPDCPSGMECVGGSSCWFPDDS